MFTHLCHNLAFRQLVCGFHFHTTAKKFLALYLLEKLTLSFTGTKDQNCFCFADRSNDVVIVVFAVVFELSFECVLRNIFFWLIRALRL